MLPGAIYRDPEFSWKYEIGPAGTTFVSGNALGPEYNGTLWIGSARSFQQVGGNSSHENKQENGPKQAENRFWVMGRCDPERHEQDRRHLADQRR